MSEPQYMSVAKQRLEGKKFPLRIWVVGPPGSGKTTQAAYLANNGYKVYALDMNGESFAGIEQFLTDKGAENLITISLYPENLEKKGDKAKSGSLHEQLEYHLENLKSAGELDDPDTFVLIDGITDWSRDIMRTSYTLTQGGSENKLVTYGVAQNEFIRQYQKLLSLTRNCSLVIIGHLKQVQISEVSPLQHAVECITKSFSVDLLNSAGISNLFAMSRDVAKDGTISYNTLTQPTHKMTFIKNSGTAFEMPATVPSTNFLPNFVKSLENKKWTEL